MNRIVGAGAIWNTNVLKESWDGYLTPGNFVITQPGYWTIVSFNEMEKALLENHRNICRLLDF